MITPPKGENRPQRKSESQDEYLDRFRHTGVNNRFAIFDWSFATLIFQRQTVVVQHTVFPPHRLPLFPFPCQVLKIEGSLGKFVWRWEFT